MAYGIGQQLEDASKLSIKELVQLQSMDPSLIYTLALQEKQKLQDAANNQEALSMQTPESTITKQMEGRMPGVQMAAQRSTPQPQMAAQRSTPQPQMAQGVSAVPAPNMRALGGAQGGIIGYAQGGTLEVNEKPNPAYLDPEVAAFLKELAALNKQKANAFPQEKDSFQQKINDLISVTSPRVMRIASESQFGLPKEDGMNMGGEVKKFQSGDIVVGEGSPLRIEGEESPLTADGDEYRFNGELISAEEYAEIARQINAAGLPVNRGKSQRDRLIDNIRGVNDKLVESELGMKPARNFLFDVADKSAEGLLNLIGYTPSSTEGVAEGLAEGIRSILPDNVDELADLLAGENRAERKKEELNAANQQALAASASASAPKTLAEILIGAQKQFDASPTVIAQEDTNDDKDDDKEGGIRNALSKTTPFLSKVMGVAEILGRGAGASKGFEGAKIVEESRKIREAQADRDARLAEQKALIAARKLELDARNAITMGMSAADYAAELTDEAIAMSDEYTRIRDEKLRKASEGITNFLTDAEERQIEAEMMAEITKIRERKLNEYKNVMAQYSGATGQAGVSTTTAPQNYADYNPAT